MKTKRDSVKQENGSAILTFISGGEQKEAYTYTSSRAAYDPVRTLYVCAPAAYAMSIEKLSEFAEHSGWREIAEEEGDVLVLPLTREGWKTEPLSLLMDCYRGTKNSFHSRSGQAIWGRRGSLWCWETLLFVAGYEDGATFAGDALVKYPGFAAATALVGGLPSSYAAGEELSCHWLVPGVSEDYQKRNSEIAVSVWLFTGEEKLDAAREASAYFSRTARDTEKVRLITTTAAGEKERSRFIFEELFARRIRWKNGPDGTLACIDPKEVFRHRPDIDILEDSDDDSYTVYVHLPAGKSREECRNLPVVLTVHGRGEPAWQFMQKNGWIELCDETGEFLVASPDSPGNIWFLERDGSIFEKIIRRLTLEYDIDTTRVYLTGFSNGAIMTREMSYAHPNLFAAVSPANGPWFDTFSMQREDTSSQPEKESQEIRSLIERFLKEGWEMPCAFIYGDSDPAARVHESRAIGVFLLANGCDTCLPERVTNDDNDFYGCGYQEPGRFTTEIYRNSDTVPYVSVTVMKNMPHGAIADESRMAWRFLKQFSRKAGSRKVTVLSEPSLS